MTFSFVGYVWALFGCACFSLFVGGVALALHFVGRRVDRDAPAAVVERIPLPGERAGGPPRGGDAA